MYPYVVVAGPDKHDALLIIACADGTRNSTCLLLSSVILESNASHRIWTLVGGGAGVGAEGITEGVT